MKDGYLIKLMFIFEEAEKPYLLDISALFYDLVLTHDLALLLSAEKYQKYVFTSRFWYRNGRSIDPNHKIRVAKILKKSPLTLEVIIPQIFLACGAFWLFVSAIEKMYKIQLDKKNLQNKIGESKQSNSEINLEAALENRGATWILSSLIGRMEKNPSKLKEIDVVKEKIKADTNNLTD